MLAAYRAHVAERALENIPAKPLDPEWTAGLVELLKNPPAGEEEFLLDLIANRVPPGVDEAAYVKAGFLKRHRQRRSLFSPDRPQRRSHTARQYARRLQRRYIGCPA